MEEDSLFHWLIQRWLETCFSTFIWLVVSGGLGRESNILVPTWRQMTIDSWQFLLIWKWIKTLRYFLSTIRGGEYNNCMPQMVKLFAFADRNMKWTNWKWHLIAIIKSSFALLLIIRSKSFENIFFHFYNELWLKCSLFKRSGLKTGVSCFLSQLLSPPLLMFRRENFCNFHKYFGER